MITEDIDLSIRINKEIASDVGRCLETVTRQYDDLSRMEATIQEMKRALERDKEYLQRYFTRSMSPNLPFWANKKNDIKQG